MKAMVQHEYGAPDDVLKLGDVTAPEAGDDEVLIRVHAAGVNWADWSGARGVPYLMRMMYGVRRPRHGIRGTDVAGTVEAIGKNVTTLVVGDEVLGQGQGTFAEHARAKAKHLVPKPKDLPFEQAAAVPMAGLVALQALRDVGNVQAGQKVLVNGASGGIGTFTVQIAKDMGAEVTGVCSTPNLDLVRSLGADHVIDYTQEDFTNSGKQYDFILDIADKASLSDRRRALTPKGTLVPNSGEGGPWFGSVGRIIGARLMSPFVSQHLRPFLSLPKRADLETLVELIESGKVTPVIDRTYPLIGAGEAVAYVGKGHARGNTILTV
jgi:NADPH:quinone reductase-like Zn-dependent oxidoreductase